MTAPTFSSRQIGNAVNWRGDVITLPAERMPTHLRAFGNPHQHWVVDTTKIRQELSYHEVVPRQQALSRTIEWERANPPSDLDRCQFDYTAEDAALHQ